MEKLLQPFLKKLTKIFIMIRVSCSEKENKEKKRVKIAYLGNGTWSAIDEVVLIMAT